MTSTFGSKKHWLLVIEDCTNYEWSYFLKEKPKLKKMMLDSIKNLKTMLFRSGMHAVIIPDNEDF